MKEREAEAHEPPKENDREHEEEVQPRETKYVFKILPVDPKNSFDFEDVADK